MEFNDKELIKINGLVIPADWDERGNVTRLSISAFDEDLYIIVKDREGDQLFPFIRSKVAVRGIVTESDGIKSIKIKEYQVEDS